MEIHSRCIRVSDPALPASAVSAAMIAFAPALAESVPYPVWQYGSMANASLGIGASLDGSVPFPADNA